MKAGVESELVHVGATPIQASQSRLAALVRLVFRFPVAVVFVLALLTLLTCRSRFNDPDIWRHIRLGKSIWSSHSLPHNDQYSYTTNNHPWVAHEWLSDVSIYLAYKLGGYQGMLLWLCIFASLVFVLLYGLCVLYSGHPRVSVLGGIMGLFFGTVSLAVRPLILGHLFLVTELLILHVARRKNRRWLWALPPLFAAWVNCHGSYLLGLLVLGIVALCSFIRIQTASLVPDTWTSRERALLCGVFLVCIAALFVNPVGPRLVTYPLDVFTGQSDGLANAAEWRALDVQDLRGLALFTMAGVIGLIFLLRRPVLRVDELALLALGFASALRHVRMLFVFAILVGPILCRLLSGARRRVERDRDNQVVYGGLILASIAIMILAFPGTDQLQRQVSSAEPVQAVDFIRRSGISGPMLNEYLWGSYLIWALPEQKVFVDSRSDIFDWTGVLREYVRWSTMQEDPGLLLDKYAIQYCLLPRAAPMSFVMRYLPGWREIYTDEVAVIFARTHR